MEATNYYKSLESFFRAAIGFAVGLLPAVTTNNILIGFGIMGISGIVSEVYLPKIMERIPGTTHKNLLVVLVIVTLLFIVTLLSGAVLEWYLRHEFYSYKPNQTLTVSFSNSRQKISLRQNWKTLFLPEHYFRASM